MDPITLHLNVFQVGVGAEDRKMHMVDDPRGTTVGALKRQLFPDAMEGQKSVRLIAGGRILKDTEPLESCGLGREAHIQVSISESLIGRAPSTAAAEGGKSVNGTFSSQQMVGDDGPGPVQSLLASPFVVFLLFLGSAAGLYYGYRRRFQLTVQMSQALVIAAAVWVYALLFHGLPGLCQAVSDARQAAAAGASVQSPSRFTAPREPSQHVHSD
mmetsp:Transcript_66108/g.158154  ORF Transcript_66108/g.158154 Transcript_66108/m.158154 type:complete len:214 (+) Transcript_66108:86-727(+)